MELYFAYGSNLSEAQMVRRCPSARPAEPARLLRHELFFSGHSTNWNGGVADLRPADEHSVFGLVYSLEVDDLALLDRFEGTYRRKRIGVMAAQELQAWIYVRKQDYPPTLPSAEYLAIMAHAYGRLGHPLEALLRAIAF